MAEQIVGSLCMAESHKNKRYVFFGCGVTAGWDHLHHDGTHMVMKTDLRFDPTWDPPKPTL